MLQYQLTEFGCNLSKKKKKKKNVSQKLYATNHLGEKLQLRRDKKSQYLQTVKIK